MYSIQSIAKRLPHGVLHRRELFVSQRVHPTNDWQHVGSRREPADDANLGWGHGEGCSGLVVQLIA